ncbi:MBOAT family protein [Campylobacter concisus]|uniref:MBOAT family protein n=1 Tax=Campylobacter concisus TaxID=199 RepID=A0A7S9NEN9_9BACT|nr:MBOAT family O-acyltransferase [Campylobacter concisus]QPH84398.1 MBOAT family protein [Campylobacter concisus]
MLFNSYVFIFVFLPLVFFVYFFLNKKRLSNLAKAFLVSASLFFYAYWSVYYLPILLGSIIFNFFISKFLAKHQSKAILIFGIVCNLALLGYFKYADFLISNLNAIANTNLSLLHIALPLALSFVTFQQIAYLVDSYNKQTKENSFLNYCLFITFFPQLIAGPIVHHKEMMPQFANKFNLIKNYKFIALGLFVFSIGLFKKSVVADTFSIFANAGFDVEGNLTFLQAWATSLSYTFQLYFDFSGYCDMAIGLALLFNIRLPINFNSPYKALNIQDFWHRWHITLSRFLRDYIYIPLGGNRGGQSRTYLNLFLVFLIGGLWHGAAWTFVVWGALHGVAIVIHRCWQKLNFKLNKIIAWIITFNFVNFTWIFFRAKSFEDAMKVIRGMFFGEFKIDVNYLEILFIVLAFLVVLLFKNSMQIAFDKKFKFTIWQIFATSFFLFISILAIRLNNASEFLYFRF